MAKLRLKQAKVVVVFLIFSISLTPLTQADLSWPMFRMGPGNTGYTSGEAPDTHDLWRIYENPLPIKYSSPAIVYNRLYIGTTETDESSLLCYDIDTGQRYWKVDVPGAIESSPAVASGKVFFTFTRASGKEAFLVCLNATTGEKIWDEQIDNYGFYSPIVYFSKLYVCSIYESDWPTTIRHGCINCFDLNGNKMWSQQMNENWVAPYNSAVAAGFTIKGKYLFVPSVKETADHHAILYELDADTGSYGWNKNLQYFSDVVAPSPVVSGSDVYITRMDDDGKTFVHRIDFGGNIEWTRPLQTGETMYIASPAIDFTQVYVVAQEISLDTHIYCLNKLTGDIIWDKEYEGKAYSCPAVADGKLYFGVGHDLYCVNSSTGNTIWTFNTLKQIYSSPAIASQMLFIATSSGQIFAFGNLPQIGEITGGLFKAKTNFFNRGVTNLTDVNWEITATGGILNLINQTSLGTIDLLEVNMTVPIKVSPIFGLGNIHIEVLVTASGQGTVRRERNGFVLGPFVILQ